MIFSKNPETLSKTGMIFWIILGIIFIVYGARVAMLYTGSRFFFVWFGLGVFCFLLATCTWLSVWSMLPLILKRLIAIVLMIGLTFFCIVEGRIIQQFPSSGSSNLDYIIVLGAQVRENGPSVVLKYRLDRAITYLEENPDTVCIVSGGQGSNEPFSEAQGMYNYLTANGISAKRILKEDQSQNTQQNIKNSMKLFHAANDTVGILTNNFHVFRGVHIAKKQGIQHAEGIAAKSTALFLPNNLLREFFGVVKDY